MGQEADHAGIIVTRSKQVKQGVGFGLEATFTSIFATAGQKCFCICTTGRCQIQRSGTACSAHNDPQNAAAGEATTHYGHQLSPELGKCTNTIFMWTGCEGRNTGDAPIVCPSYTDSCQVNKEQQDSSKQISCKGSMCESGTEIACQPPVAMCSLTPMLNMPKTHRLVSQAAAR